METGDVPGSISAFRTSADRAIEESGLLGTRRGWANINRFEVIFLVVAILAALVTDTLTIIRLADITNDKDSDLAYGVLILVHSVFLLLFLITGIFYQRITDIVSFFISAVLLTIYVIVHYIARLRTKGDQPPRQETLRLVRLIFVVGFNICFVPLAIVVIRDYRRDEFSKRLFGAFPSARRPLKIYNIFDCLARINTMLSISTLLLNLYNFNSYESIDKVFLIIGIPLAFIWLGVGVGMVRLESRILVGVFYVISLFQPGVIGYCLYSAITTNSTDKSTIGPITSTTNSMITSEPLSSSTTVGPPSLLPVVTVLYVCIGCNLLTNILSMVFGFYCVRNFGKDLKQRVFNNRFDKWIEKRWPNII